MNHTRASVSSSGNTQERSAVPGAPGKAPAEPGFGKPTQNPSTDVPDGAAEALPPGTMPQPLGPDGGAAVLERRSAKAPFEGSDKRKNSAERRAGMDRRVIDIGSPTGLERRRGPGRRRADDRRSAEEGEMTDEQFEFILAVDTYKRLNNRPFPTWTEILEVVKQLGYRKVAASSLSLPASTARSNTVPSPSAAASTPPAAPPKESEFMPG